VSAPYDIGFAQTGDIESWMQLVELVADNFPGLVTDDYRQTLIRNVDRQSAICAKANGKVVGALLYSVNAGTLSCMAVHPEHRRHGIASAMIRLMIDNFPTGADISVSTFREGDPLGDAPRAMYKRLGFLEGELIEEFGHPGQIFRLCRSSSS